VGGPGLFFHPIVMASIIQMNMFIESLVDA